MWSLVTVCVYVHVFVYDFFFYLYEPGNSQASCSRILLKKKKKVPFTLWSNVTHILAISQCMRAHMVSWAQPSVWDPCYTEAEGSPPVGLGIINIHNQYTGKLCGKRALQGTDSINEEVGVWKGKSPVNRLSRIWMCVWPRGQVQSAGVSVFYRDLNTRPISRCGKEGRVVDGKDVQILFWPSVCSYCSLALIIYANKACID